MNTLSKSLIPAGLKPLAGNLVWRCREMTSARRALPDFIVIGAQRAGTSSLYDYLGQHPQIAPSYRKEVHFFDGGRDPDVDAFAKGVSWYRSNFPLRSEVRAGRKVFEASPLYMFSPLVPGRIHQVVPEARLIALLRDPGERAISHYFHERRRGREALPIMEALRSEEQRLEPAWAARDYKNPLFINCSYKSRGLYREQLERFLEYFPRSQVLVLQSEALFREPAETLRRVFEFVGVDPGVEISDLAPRNVGANRVDVGVEVREYLDDYFRPHNRSLFEFLGTTYDW